MIVALARKTLIYEWRKFLPAVLAVAFSGLLLMMMTALMFGIFSSAGVYVSKSSADLWAGSPGTQSIELGRPVPADTSVWLELDPAVVRAEPFQWIDGDWRGPVERGSVTVFISGIDPSPGAMMFSQALTPEQRAALYEPAGVIVDAADLPKLGLGVGGTAVLNGHIVKIVAAANGLRALGGVNIVTSIATARMLVADPADRDRVAYYVARLAPGSDPEAVRSRLAAVGARHGFAVWTRDEFARHAATYWMFETGAGLGFVFLAIVVFIVGVVITSQTLFAAVASSVREYAMLNALGAGLAALRRVVLEQAFWVGLAGIGVGAIVSLAIAVIGRGQDVPISFDALTGAACATLVMALALISGLLAVGAINELEPANLLR
ncbi:MAG TPA: FtsX-like permease family protein [Rudaea sp.]|nr:FtsX-like permease family protein [Rudaea sp.]